MRAKLWLVRWLVYTEHLPLFLLGVWTWTRRELSERRKRQPSCQPRPSLTANSSWQFSWSDCWVWWESPMCYRRNLWWEAPRRWISRQPLLTWSTFLSFTCLRNRIQLLNSFHNDQRVLENSCLFIFSDTKWNGCHWPNSWTYRTEFV